MKRKLRNRRNAKKKELTFNDVLSLGEFHYTENSKEDLDFRATFPINFAILLHKSFKHP